MGIMGGWVDLGKGCVGVLFRVADIRVCKGDIEKLRCSERGGQLSLLVDKESLG